jgi:hypothetical protein
MATVGPVQLQLVWRTECVSLKLAARLHFPKQKAPQGSLQFC